MRRLLFLLFIAASLSQASYRIFWVDIWHPGVHTRAEADTMLNAAVKAKANAVFIGVRAEGHAYYLKRMEPPPQPGWTYEPGFDAISYILDRGHALGLEVHAWVDMAPLWNTGRGYVPADPTHKWHKHGNQNKGPDLWITSTELSDHKGGSNGGMIDFGHPGAARHVADVAVDVLRHYSLDGLHLDYIRYPYAIDISNNNLWDPEFYGYNPTSIERFNRLHNRSGRPAQSDPLWQAWRRNQVTDVVRQVYLRAKEIRPSARVSAAVVVWGAPPVNENFHTTEPYKVGSQDWHSWLQEGIIDFVTPMLYRTETNTADRENFDSWLTWFSDHKHGREIVPGMSLYQNTVANSFAQIERVRNHPGKFAGVAMFAHASTNNQKISNANFYDMLGAHWGDAPAVPSMPWITNQPTGYVSGQVTVPNGSAYAADGLDIEIRNATTGLAKKIVSDGSGFFGAAGLAPGNYYVAIQKDGKEIYMSDTKALYSSAVTRFDATTTGEATTACTYTVTPRPVSMSAAGGTAEVAVTASASTCEWAAGAGSAWVTLAGASTRTGSSVLQYTFTQNMGPARAGEVTIAGHTIAISQAAPAGCVYQIDPLSITMGSAGGTAQVNVTASLPTCEWFAGSGYAGWVFRMGSGSRTGSSVVQYVIDSNVGDARTGSVTVAGTSIQLKQSGKDSAASCTYQVNPLSVTMGAAGGTANVSVTASAQTCQWTAGTGLNWGLTLTGSPNRTGSSILEYSFPPNTGAVRSGNVTIANSSVAMSQAAGTVSAPAACTYQINPLSITMGAAGGTANVAVTASAPTCEWTAGTGLNWGLTLAGSPNRTGSSVLQYAFTPNTGAVRSGYVTIATTSVTMTQAASTPPVQGCTYQINPPSTTMGAAGGTATIAVTASEPTCVWTAGLGFAGWVQRIGPGSRIGSSAVQYSIASNTGSAARSGSVMVAGISMPLTQSGTATTQVCAYQVNPSSITMSAAGGTASIIVTASSPTCEWTAGTGFNWGLALTGSPNRTGSSVLEYTFQPNAGTTRSGFVAIADRSIQMMQLSAAVPPPAQAVCTYDLNPKVVNIGAPGGTVDITVTASAPTCNWTAGVGYTWGLTLIGSPYRTGSSVLKYSVEPNTGRTRSGYVPVADTSIAFMQWDR